MTNIVKFIDKSMMKTFLENEKIKNLFEKIVYIVADNYKKPIFEYYGLTNHRNNSIKVTATKNNISPETLTNQIDIVLLNFNIYLGQCYLVDKNGYSIPFYKKFSTYLDKYEKEFIDSVFYGINFKYKKDILKKAHKNVLTKLKMVLQQHDIIIPTIYKPKKIKKYNNDLLYIEFKNANKLLETKENKMRQKRKKIIKTKLYQSIINLLTLPEFIIYINKYDTLESVVLYLKSCKIPLKYIAVFLNIEEDKVMEIINDLGDNYVKI